MTTTESLRTFVVARAGGACEYCRLIEYATGMTFHIEHVLPRSQGGITVIDNLALSCPGCNLAKSDHTRGKDLAGRMRPLFNPRSYEPWHLGWHLHFALDHQTGVIVARSGIGEATVLMLQVNSASRLFARHLQIRAGLIG